MAQSRKIGQFHSRAASRRDVRRGKSRRASLLTSILGVVVVCVMSFAGSAAPASAATTTVRSEVLAWWYLTDGCVRTEVAAGSTKTVSGPPTTWLHLTQLYYCEPNTVRQGVTLHTEGPGGYTPGGKLKINPSHTKARLVATIPVTCFAGGEIGPSCDQEPYNRGSVSLNLSWTTTGEAAHRPAEEDGWTCTQQSGTATGSIQLGDGVNLLATDDGTLNSDRSDTYVDRCVT